MLESIIYFFRQKIYFFYSGLFVFSILYSYVLGLYFLEWTEFQKDLFHVLLLLSLAWFITFFINYKANLELFRFDREKEKFYIFQKKVSVHFGLNKKNNIFEKINFIKKFVQNNYNERGLFSIKILVLINKTLYLYIENLEIIENLKTSLEIINNPIKAKKIEREINKNNLQNNALLDHLDEYIHELTNKKVNDGKIASIQSELEHTMRILKDINPR